MRRPSFSFHPDYAICYAMLCYAMWIGWMDAGVSERVEGQVGGKKRAEGAVRFAWTTQQHSLTHSPVAFNFGEAKQSKGRKEKEEEEEAYQVTCLLTNLHTDQLPRKCERTTDTPTDGRTKNCIGVNDLATRVISFLSTSLSDLVRGRPATTIHPIEHWPPRRSPAHWLHTPHNSFLNPDSSFQRVS